MNSSARRIPPANRRPESQPHGTTEDQIHGMESESPGAKPDDRGLARSPEALSHDA